MIIATRRMLIGKSMALLGLGAAAASAGAAPAETLKTEDRLPASMAPDAIQKVVYHLSDLDKVEFVLGNIRNHIKGKGGEGRIRIALVVHGPPIAAFVAASASPKVTAMVGRHAAAGVALMACGNTLTAMDIAPGDLMPGFEVVAEGGVTRICDLQAEGWLYIRS